MRKAPRDSWVLLVEEVFLGAVVKSEMMDRLAALAHVVQPVMLEFMGRMVSLEAVGS